MRSNGQVTPGFGTGNEAEVWTKEKIRLYQFYQIEAALMEAELKMDWPSVIRSCRVYLRLLMELMTEEMTDPETGRKKKVYGTQTGVFKDMKQRLDELETRYANVQRRNSDPSVRSNAQEEYNQLIADIRDYEDKLFFINTSLGVNYKRRDVYDSWKE